MFYAIIENGGKQYKAVEGSAIEVDCLPVEVGKKIKLDKVLLLSDSQGARVGTPLLSDVNVDATVMMHFKGPKIVIFKYRAKQRYRVKTGHRQQYTRLMVDAIVYPGKPKTEKMAEAKPAEPTLKTKKAAVKPQKKAAEKKPSVKPKAATIRKTTSKKSK